MLVRHDSHQDVDIYDIYACPSGTKITVPDNTALTIGDLHGNALKLLWFCLASGIATWKDGVKGPETYALLVAAYCHYQDKFEEFCKLINNNIQFDTGFFNTKKLRLIGDELADRGKDDRMTIFLMEQIFTAAKKCNMQSSFEILFSNHTDWFFQYLNFFQDKESKDEDNQEDSQDEESQGFDERKWDALWANLSHAGQGESLLVLLINFAKPSRENIEMLRKQIFSIYTPESFKLISYDIDSQHGIFNYYTHAPFSLKCIKRLAIVSGVPVPDVNTQAGLITCIEAINQSFYEKITTGYPPARPKFNDNKNPELLVYDDDMWTAVIWNRFTDFENEPKTIKINANDDILIRNVCGHTSFNSNSKRICLNQDLGTKQSEVPRNQAGFYVTCAQELKHEFKEEVEDNDSTAAITLIYSSIDEISSYGMTLQGQGASKGDVLIGLGCTLRSKMELFFQENKSPTKEDWIEFEKEFNLLLSENSEIKKYRFNLKTCLKNIAIALTGIGALIIAGKLIYSACVENRATFFFQEKQTTSEKKINQVREAVKNAKKSS